MRTTTPWPVKKGMGRPHIIERGPLDAGIGCSVCGRLTGNSRAFWWGDSFMDSEEIHVECL